MHQDYAGYIDKNGWDEPGIFEAKIKKLESENNLTDKQFESIVQDYLLDFKDPHLFFKRLKLDAQPEEDLGFRVRRYEDKLYVTSLTTENRIQIGDRIVSLDHVPILQVVERHKRELMETVPEREDWRKILVHYDVMEIEDTLGIVRNVHLQTYLKTPYEPKHTLEVLNENTILLTLTDFMDPTPIEKLLYEHKDTVDNSTNLIIDVRTNHGGSTLSYKNLETYLFPKG